jgi:hypothetical protein
MAEKNTVEVAKCSIDGCTRPAFTAGLCLSHYRRQRLYGDPLASKRKFAGIETKVIGITLPVGVVEVAGQNDAGEKVATFLTQIVLNSAWGKKALEAADIDMSKAAAFVATRNKSEAEAKPRKRKAKKEAA